MKKILAILPSSILALFLFIGVASAHVEISPDQVSQGTEQVFTINVPVEKDIPSTKVKVTVPDKIDIESIEPAPGWTYSIEKDANGKITSITWTTVDKGLLPGEFAQFNITGTAEKGTKALRWKAYQTYKDGSIVKWIGPEDSDHPAPVTEVTVTSTDQANAGAQTNTSQWSLYLSIFAVILGFIAIILSIVTGRKKSK